jgi:hypothetical protein
LRVSLRPNVKRAYQNLWKKLKRPLIITRGVSHIVCGLAIYIKRYLKKAKEELNISPCKKNINNLQKKKNPLKEIKILQAIITL